MLAGPVEPWHPPSMFGRDDEPRVGVDGGARADDVAPPAGGRMPGAGGTAHVAVAGEGVQHEHRVVARRR